MSLFLSIVWWAALAAPGYGAVTSPHQGRPDRSRDRLRTFGVPGGKLMELGDRA